MNAIATKTTGPAAEKAQQPDHQHHQDIEATLDAFRGSIPAAPSRSPIEPDRALAAIAKTSGGPGELKAITKAARAAMKMLSDHADLEQHPAAPPLPGKVAEEVTTSKTEDPAPVALGEIPSTALELLDAKPNDDVVLVQLDIARAALAECKTVMEIKKISAVAEAVSIYLERTNASIELVNRATEIKLLAERRMGEFLKTTPKATGARGIGTSVVPDRNHTPPTLAEIGITKKESSQAQKLADIPATEFRQRIATAKIDGGKLTAAKVVQSKPTARRAAPSASPNRAMLIASGAIESLKTISPDDDERAEALRSVRNWCDEQLASPPQQPR